MNPKALLFFLITIFLVSTACTQGQPPPAASSVPLNILPISEPQLNHSLASTVGLISRTSDEPQFSCTGVIVSTRYVLTAEHCISNDRRSMFGVVPGPDPIGDPHELIYYSMFQETRFDESITYRVLARDQDRDLALLERKDPVERHTYTISGLYHGRVHVGDFVYVIGHPVGIPYNLSSGYISRLLTEEDGVYRLFTNAHVYYGNSGGPIFDDRGNIIAITSQIVRGEPYLNKGVYVRSIREFLSDNYLQLP